MTVDRVRRESYIVGRIKDELEGELLRPAFVPCGANASERLRGGGAFLDSGFHYEVHTQRGGEKKSDYKN